MDCSGLPPRVVLEFPAATLTIYLFPFFRRQVELGVRSVGQRFTYETGHDLIEVTFRDDRHRTYLYTHASVGPANCEHMKDLARAGLRSHGP